MILNIDTIRRRVYSLLDENPEILDERVEYADPGTSVTWLLETLLPEAARETVLAADPATTDECTHVENLPALSRAGGKWREVQLPEDFAQLVGVRMSDWEDGISRTLPYGEEEYRLRTGDTAASRRRRLRPAAAIRKAGMNSSLILFGTESGSCAELDYLSLPVIRDNLVEIPSSLAWPLCRRLASEISQILQS